MATFFSLPNEIVLQVVETTEPDDIENFVLCCKRVYVLAWNVLKQHRKHKRIFSSFDLGPGRHCCGSEIQAAYSSLHDLSKSRFLQLYPKAVEVENFVHTGVVADERRICDSIFQDFDTPYFDKIDIEIWHSIIGRRGSLPTNCLLLALLPNVRNITVWENNTSSSGLGKMIEKISKTNDGASQQIWGKLSLLRLQEADIRWRTSLVRQTRALEAFMSLPSLKVIRGRNLAPSFNFQMRTYPDHFSNVTQFHFRGCALPEWYFAVLVQRPRALQVFSYDHCQRAEIGIYNYRPDKHMESLYSCAEETLSFLNYTSDVADYIGDHSKPNSGILHKYKALKTLRISRVLLIAEGTPRRLVDELPSSLEELEIVEPISAAEAQQMLDGMLAMRPERYASLRLIVFEGVIPLDHDQIVAYERIGLVLDRRNTDTNTIIKSGQKWLGGIECERR